MPLTFTPCQPLIGAEVSGVDLTKPIASDVAQAIRDGLVKYQVLVFRDQDVTRAQHKALAEVWAVDVPIPFPIQKAQAHPVPEYPEIFNLMADGVNKSAADVWHTDESFRPCPPTASVLRCKVTPSLGGDTIFSSGIVAYERLPDEIKEKVRYLKAPHGPIFQEVRGNTNPAKMQEMIDENPAFEQPVVRLHPDSLKPVLFVNYNYTGPISGLEGKEEEKLRLYLFDQFRKPDYQMRVKWRPHTIVVWDNASVQHYAVYDYNEPRHMERILVAGNRPTIGFADTERDSALKRA